MNKKLSDRILDVFFDKDKTRLFLILALILAFTLRFWAAATMQPFADDLVYGTHAINFLSSGATSNQNQSPLWFSLADIFYRVFGVSLTTGRLTSIIFGSLTVLVTFLIANLIFGRRIAIISSFLLAISGFHIREMVMEMDVTSFFFALFAVYLFLEELINKDKISIFSFVFLGLAVLSKTIPITALPGLALAFLVFYLNKKDKRKELLNKKNFRTVLISILILFIALIPILSYNYLLYKEKGLLDVMFARFLGIGMDYFSSIEATLPSFSLNIFIPGLKTTLYNFFFLHDMIIFPLSILGLIIAFRKKLTYSIMLISAFLFTYIFLTGTSVLGNHFVFAPAIYSIFAAIPLDWISKKLKWKYILPIFLLLILIVNIFVLGPNILSKSPTGQLRSFANSNIDDNSLVVMDSRIYIGLTSWTMNDKHYIDASLLPTMFEELKKINTKEEQINTFFVECVPDNCGGVPVNPNLNASMEQLILQFGEPVKIIYSGGGDGDPSKPYFKIYKATILQKLQLLNLVDQTHIFFYYPVGWKLKNQIYDSYTPEGTIDNSIDISAHLVLYLAIILALLSPLFLVYKLYETFKKSNQKESNNEDNSNSTSL